MGAVLIADLAGVLQTSGAILKVAVGLGFVVFVHELGHFLVAKMCGVKCEKFYVGFDVPIRIGPIKLPAYLCRFQWGETEYGIGTIPLGGYVKMLGQNDNPNEARAEAERIRVNKEEESGKEGDGDYDLDPRSYPAKAVPKRMAIISAGVIMNLIFGYFFAVAALRLGVDDVPAKIGGTAPGSDAWVQNLKPSGKIIQVGTQDEESRHVRWTDMLREVILNGGRSDMLLVVQEGGETRRLDVRARKLTEDSEHPAIGIRMPFDNVITKDEPAVVDYLPAGKVEESFHCSDRIVAVDNREVSDGQDIAAVLAQNPGKELRFSIQRRLDGPAGDGKEDSEENSKLLEISVPPNPLKEVGIELEPGPIVAIQNDSPAAASGFMKGDQIQKVDNQPVGDCMTLSQRILPLVNTTIEVEVLRKGEEVTLLVTPTLPLGYTKNANLDSPIAVDELGIAFKVINKIAHVRSGSPADQKGLRPGDMLISAAFEKGDEKFQEKMKELGAGRYDEPIGLDKKASWPSVHYMMQQFPPGADLTVKYSRNDKEQSATLKPVDSKTLFSEDRGLRLRLMSQTRKAENWQEAATLGLTETTDRFLEVLRVLRQLVTGKIGFNSLAGPVGIMRAAGHEANEGYSNLLLFLTMLSVNLAIVNFLPIPVLDGGHMLFLSWEFVMGKPVNENLQMRLSMAGLLLLLVLIVFVSYRDILRIFDG